MTKNETQKTGFFWGVAGVTSLLAAIVAWPTAVDTSEDSIKPGTALFPKFTDPLAAGNLKIVTFDDEQGTLQNFEVKRDEKTGFWTIPSRGGYPADAVDQMREAANAFVDLNILDVPSVNAEDHGGFGVIEPNADTLSVGDEGVGRLVTFRGPKDDLGSLIIGKKVPNQEGQVYVRIPNQDPVYAVKLDDSPLTTNFEDWIEEDLLQLSSIDIDNIEVKDYTASFTLRGVALNRNYVANFKMDGTEWKLDSLGEYDPKDPLAKPKPVEVKEDDKLNTKKLNEIKNALDDLKFVNVLRKPEGISADLKADKDFASNKDAASALASKGFYPVPMGADGAIEILSENGELTTTLKSGVKYVLRFGKISGVSKGDDEKDSDDESTDESSEEQEEDKGGVNRYLMVSTSVDESMFPLPELERIPQNVAEMEAMEREKKPDAPDEKDLPPELNQPELNQPSNEPSDAPEMKAKDAEGDDATADDSKDGESTEKKADDPEKTGDEADKKDDGKEEADKDSETKPESDDAKEPSEPDSKPEDSDGSSEAEPGDAPSESEEPAADAKPTSETESGETDASGSGEASGVGEGQEPDEGDDAKSDEESDAAKDDGAGKDEKEDSPDAESTEAVEPAQASDEKSTEDAKPDGETKPAAETEPAGDAPEETQETEEEKQERLAAVQERITKENERKLDERKEKLEEARRKSRELNQRFADWYYVIPEATYSKLRIDRDEVFDDGSSDAAAPPAGGLPPGFGAGPGFNFPPAGN